MYNVELKPKAVNHIKKATFWYSQQQKELGIQFLDDLNNAFEILEINPFYAKRYKEVRGYPLRKFPFLLLYTVNEKKKKVSILAVFHTSQNPMKYPKE